MQTITHFVNGQPVTVSAMAMPWKVASWLGPRPARFTKNMIRSYATREKAEAQAAFLRTQVSAVDRRTPFQAEVFFKR